LPRRTRWAIDKAHKWFITRGDLDYTVLGSLRGYAAGSDRVMGARLLADREVIPQAMKLNPAFFKTTMPIRSMRRRHGRACRRR